VLLPQGQLDSVSFHHLKELFVGDFPESDSQAILAEESQVCQQLAEPYFRG
jgi:hypothetical protein